MSPIFGTRDGTPRRRAVAFQEIEMYRLISLYCTNYSKYHSKNQGGGRNGTSIKDRLLEQWSRELSYMGIAHRSKEQIEEKLRNEVKRVQRFLRSDNGVCNCTYKHESPHYHKALPPYLDPLIKLMTNGPPAGESPGAEDPLSVSRDESDLLPMVARQLQTLSSEHEGRPFGKSLDHDEISDIKIEEILLVPREKCGVFLPSEGLCSDRDELFDAEKDIQQNIVNLWKAAKAQQSVESDLLDACDESLLNASVMKQTLNGFKTTDFTVLYEEELKLMRLKQEECVAALEVRKLQMEKLRLEIDMLKKGVCPRQD
ncbi:unnamed protein product [Nippostrongylus brasiliensis]|uniref:Regulatory protein zeste n=1 Tax=Nippostrongylus brasiliensis TaxID=27835 RepID=A0A0N4Y310_NIPBR|nr:unnamed protein product [Nippostrongylus brasiliensis]